EERVEADRILMATRKALAADADLLEEGERERIEDALRMLEEAKAGTKPALIHGGVEALDNATHAWAGRRMDRAIAKAIEGKQVEDVETQVASAQGVDAHVEAHTGGAGGR